MHAQGADAVVLQEDFSRVLVSQEQRKARDRRLFASPVAWSPQLVTKPLDESLDTVRAAERLRRRLPSLSSAAAAARGGGGGGGVPSGR